MAITKKTSVVEKKIQRLKVAYSIYNVMKKHAGSKLVVHDLQGKVMQIYKGVNLGQPTAALRPAGERCPHCNGTGRA